MMNEFWMTVLNSPVIASLAECALLCGVILLLQHLYNKKLEEHKADVQKKIDEHQTRFNWWYLEKAKAIKTIYANLATASYLLQKIHSIETDPRWQINQQCKEQSRQQTLLLLVDALEKNTKDWFQFRLFFEEKDDFSIQDSILDEAHFLDFYILRLANNKIEDLRNIGPVLLNEIERKMRLLRNAFRDTLGIQNQDVAAPSVQTYMDDSANNEVKS